jgi:lysophospholipase L1-like esterase
MKPTIDLRLRRKSSIISLALLLTCAVHVATPAAFAQDHWVGTWATAPVGMASAAEGAVAFNNQTLRQIVHVSIGGRSVRVRLSNAFGSQPLAVGSAHIALRSAGAAIKPGSDRTLTFGGAESTTIWPGALMVSDAVELDVPALGDLAVSIYLSGDVPATLPTTGHRVARQTNYVSPAGDFTASADMPFSTTTQSWYFLSGVEVMAPQQARAVIVLGDSITDSNLSTADTNHRWPDQLARRLSAARLQVGVLNEGTAGNRILHDFVGENGLHRFDRDVLSQSGVAYVIVLLGINDLRNRVPAEVTADDMIAGYKQMILRAHARGIRIFGGTLLPFENETFTPGAYTPEGEAKRQAVNAWIRTSGAFDAVIDFDRALRDPSHPTSYLPKYDNGDHLHPSDLGYQLMGDTVDLALFK